MKKIAIIGAGVFGCSAALELTKNDFDVTIFERSGSILSGASTVNHLRHHYGFHYPRSKDTVEEIKSARKSFEEEYGECVSDFFDDYYGVALEGSQTTPDDFIKFCDNMELPYEVAWPEENMMDKSKIGTCVKTPERVYDPDILKGLIVKRIRKTAIKLKLYHKVVKGNIKDSKKTLSVECADLKLEEEFDYVINATYSNFNSFNKMFGFPRKKLQYELMELLELHIPIDKKIGLTIMDGEFSSVLPRGEKGTFTLGHVDASVLKRIISDELDPFDMTLKNAETNKDEILKRGVEDYPFLKDAKVLKSLFVTRVVKPDVEDTDERPSEITEYGNGLYSIFGGKVITCIEIAKRVTKLIIEHDKKEGGK